MNLLEYYCNYPIYDEWRNDKSGFENFLEATFEMMILFKYFNYPMTNVQMMNSFKFCNYPMTNVRNYEFMKFMKFIIVLRVKCHIFLSLLY